MPVTLAGSGVRYCDQSGQVCAAIINRDTDVGGHAELTQFTRNGPAVRFAVRFSEDPMPNCWSHGHVYLDEIVPDERGTMSEIIQARSYIPPPPEAQAKVPKDLTKVPKTKKPKQQSPSTGGK